MNWGDEDLEYLRTNYSRVKSISLLVDHLKRSRRAILHKAARLGLSRIRVPHNKPLDPNHRKLIDRRYYERNKNQIYTNKRARVLRYKKELVALLGGSCAQCGYDRCSAAFDFHHINGEKEKALAVLLNSVSKEKILKEAKKCMLLCANCHRELHHKGL